MGAGIANKVIHPSLKSCIGTWNVIWHHQILSKNSLILMLRPLRNSFLYLELLIILPRRKLACHKENIAHHEGHEGHEVF
jgi:hypothetical protein